MSTECGQKTRTFHGTWTQAQDALSAFVTELSGIVPNSDTFASYAASWHRWRVSVGDLAPGTYENERRNIAALCRTPLAGMRMDELTPESCRDALMWLKEHPARPTASGRLTNTTMNKIVQTLKMVTAQAFDDGRIARDPMAKVAPPRPDTKEREAMSPAELDAFLDAVDSELPLDGRSMALYFMACLGLRRGEALAVMDGDVADGFCRIRFSVKERDNSIAEPKTKAGVRTLPMPPRLQAKVDGWRAMRRELGFDACPTLCCNTYGRRMTVQPFQKWWTRVRARLGCDGMTMHQLRHSNLSKMARYMSAFDLQRYAGWSSIAPAMVYVHEDLSKISAAVDAAWGTDSGS